MQVRKRRPKKKIDSGKFTVNYCEKDKLITDMSSSRNCNKYLYVS